MSSTGNKEIEHWSLSPELNSSPAPSPRRSARKGKTFPARVGPCPRGPRGKALPAGISGPEENLLGFFRAEGLEGRAPRALGPRARKLHGPSLCEELQSLGCGATVKSSWQGQRWPLAEAAKPRPTCWHCRGGRRHPGVPQAPGGAECCLVARDVKGTGPGLGDPFSPPTQERAHHPSGPTLGDPGTVVTLGLRKGS